MREWYITFRQSSEHRNCFAIVVADSRAGAIQEANDTFPGEWSMCYQTADEAGVSRYGLRLWGTD